MLNKIINIEQAKQLKGKIVFTNGCFDILHRGHVQYLHEAKSLGDILIVGLNTDSSVSKLKPGRPINNEWDRAIVLAALQSVDYVILFSEETPLELIKKIKPHFICKGGDYKLEEVVGYNEVKSWSGEVKIIPYQQGYSTTGLINKITS